MIKHIHDTLSYRYANDVLDGKIISGKWIKLAARRFINDLENCKFIFDLNKVNQVNSFFNQIVYIPELKTPNTLQPPHAFWIDQLFGFKMDETGLRRFKSMYMQVARKNFKTFYCAGISLFEGEFGIENDCLIMHGANSRDQAIICTDKTGSIIKSSPDLREMMDCNQIELFTYRKKTTEIVHDSEDRFYRIVAMPRDPGDGENPSVGIVDEFHEAQDVTLLETIESGQGQRLEPLTVVITSPGHDKYGPCYQILRKHSIDILEGRIEDDRSLGIVWELDSEDEWDQIDLLEKANPMMPYSKTLRPYLIDRIKDAKDKGGVVEVNVKIKNSGIWVDASDVWIPTDVWVANHNPKLVESDLDGLPYFGGADLASTRDLSAYVRLYPEVPIWGNTKKAVRMNCWLPEDNLDEHVNYRKWAEQGFITLTPGNHSDQQQIVEEIMSMDISNLVRMHYDKFMFEWMVGIMANSGVIASPVGQSFNLSQTMEELQTVIQTGELEHFNNPVLRWAMGNILPKYKNNGSNTLIAPDKGNAKNKIDPAVAMILSYDAHLESKSNPIGNAGGMVLEG